MILVSFTVQLMGPDLIDCKGAMQTWAPPFRDQQHLDSDNDRADIFVEREQKNVYRGPGVSLERRIVEFADPPRPRRDSSTRRPGRSSGPGNPHRQKMVPAGKGILGFHGYRLCPSDSSRSP